MTDSYTKAYYMWSAFMNMKYTHPKSCKSFCDENQALIKEGHKEHYLRNKEAINKRHLEYYHTNKEKLCQQKREYYKANSELVECDCGSKVIKIYLNRHKKTKKHIEFEKTGERVERTELSCDIDVLTKLGDTLYCKCGGVFNKDHKRRHFNTKKHKKYVKILC